MSRVSTEGFPTGSIASGPVPDDALLTQVFALAEQARRAGDHPFGALLAVEGQPVAQARNLVVTNRDITAHAEMTLVREVERLGLLASLAARTVYASCEPCPMCLGALFWAGSRRIVFGLTAVQLTAWRPRRGMNRTVSPSRRSSWRSLPVPRRPPRVPGGPPRLLARASLTVGVHAGSVEPGASSRERSGGRHRRIGSGGPAGAHGEPAAAAGSGLHRGGGVRSGPPISPMRSAAPGPGPRSGWSRARRPSR